MDVPEVLNSGKLVEELSDGFYFDSARNCYLRDTGTKFLKLSKEDVKNHLVHEHGLTSTKRDGELASEVNSAIYYIQLHKDIDYANRLSGFARGLHENNGHRILVTHSAKLIEPSPGEWPTIRKLLNNMLPDGQTIRFYGWLQVGLKALHSGTLAPGQVAVFCGPPKAGKSRVQNNILTPLFGGRAESPMQFMMGETSFNSNLFTAGHLKIEDEAGSPDPRIRRKIGVAIKQFSAAETPVCHGKNRDALSLDVFWRCSISVNSEPSALLVLPDVEPSIADKMFLFKCTAHPMPMPTTTPEEMKAFREKLAGELPAFSHYIQKEFQIPKEFRDPRFGVRYFHHPEILDTLGKQSPSEILLELIDLNAENLRTEPTTTEVTKIAMETGFKSGFVWSGSAAQLEAKLTHHDSLGHQRARKLFYYNSACGSHLASLAGAHTERVKKKSDRIWEIYIPPVGG